MVKYHNGEMYVIPQELIDEIRADALDDLVRMVSVYYTMQERAGYYSDTNNMIKQRIADFAEQLKGAEE